MTLAIIPMSIREARAFVLEHHRHHKKVTGALFACGVACKARQEFIDVTMIGTDDWKNGRTTVIAVPPSIERVCGVAICGRPKARGLQDGWTVEITRVCTDGTQNACSILYAACRRAAIALGYKLIVTYTGKHESGSSLRAAGFRVVADVRGRSWSCPSRPRVDTEPAQHKLRWEAAA